VVNAKGFYLLPYSIEIRTVLLSTLKMSTALKGTNAKEFYLLPYSIAFRTLLLSVL